MFFHWFVLVRCVPLVQGMGVFPSFLGWWWVWLGVVVGVWCWGLLVVCWLVVLCLPGWLAGWLVWWVCGGWVVWVCGVVVGGLCSVVVGWLVGVGGGLCGVWLCVALCVGLCVVWVVVGGVCVLVVWWLPSPAVWWWVGLGGVVAVVVGAVCGCVPLCPCAPLCGGEGCLFQGGVCFVVGCPCLLWGVGMSKPPCTCCWCRGSLLSNADYTMWRDSFLDVV